MSRVNINLSKYELFIILEALVGKELEEVSEENANTISILKNYLLSVYEVCEVTTNE